MTKEGSLFDSAVANMKPKGKLGIALNMNGATLQLVKNFTKAKFIIIHNKSKYKVFHVEGKPRLISAIDEMTDIVTTKNGASTYLVYNTVLNDDSAYSNLYLTPITKSDDSDLPHLLPIRILQKENVKSTASTV